MAQPPLHPDLEPIAFLLGTWTGEGKGLYPTIDAFAYREESTFSHNGKPLLAYHQRTWSLDDGRPLHSETGYWRPQPAGVIEVVLAHSFGIVEVGEGTVTGMRIELESTTLVSTPSAKAVASLSRTLELHDDALAYSIDMAARDLPLQPHLNAELRRAG